MASFPVKTVVVLIASASTILLASAEVLEDYDEDMQNALIQAADRANTVSNYFVVKGIYRVFTAEREERGGKTLYRFEFALRDTDCQKRGDKSDLRECHLLTVPQSRDLSCTAELVGERGGSRNLTELDCGIGVVTDNRTDWLIRG